MKTIAIRKWVSVLGRIGGAIAALAILLLTIAWLAGMFTEKVKPGWTARGADRLTDEPTDLVHEIRKETIEQTIGTLKASSRTVVSSKLLATIDKITVSAGEEVVEGQLLVELDSDEYQSRLNQSKQALEAAAAHHAQAERNATRVDTLMRQNAASPSDQEMATRDLQVAAAEENRARQAVSEAAVMMSYTKIMAAKQGRIVDRFAEPGDVAKPGEPILVLYDSTSLRIEAPVPEHLAVKLKIGDPLKLYVDALDKHYDVLIDEIVPQADAPSRSFLVKATLPSADDLYEGMFGRLQIPSGVRRHLCLADRAVISVGQLDFVDVVLADGTIERRLIKSGQLGMPGRHEVLSGLKAGERVILQQTSSKTSGHDAETVDAESADVTSAEADERQAQQ